MRRVSALWLDADPGIVRGMMQRESSNERQRAVMQDALHRTIERDLTARQRQLILMYFYDELDVTEIAKETNLDKSTVSRTLKRAKERIRKSMQFYVDYMNRFPAEM
ncbi:MAG: sigma-70 family RNA polymerase sigma factor [Oscillospiraceae bacterium]|nr:sigma-70 family RNA polymerase sigma factor [Oscillospiraceae bacterium]MBQ7012525.1 sigma-70 family RNA polymerase sigma factor [Oscillospiraceae bacterium]